MVDEAVSATVGAITMTMIAVILGAVVYVGVQSMVEEKPERTAVLGVQKDELADRFNIVQPGQKIAWDDVKIRSSQDGLVFDLNDAAELGDPVLGKDPTTVGGGAMHAGDHIEVCALVPAKDVVVDLLYQDAIIYHGELGTVAAC